MTKTILLTGATSGMGRALAKDLAQQEKFSLILMGRNQEKLDALQINSAHTYCVDIMDEEALEKTIKEILSKHTVDILINNAGIGVPTELDEQDLLKKYNAMMNTNVRAVVSITASVLTQMKTSGKGQIINISSEAGLATNPVAPLYCASKFAVESYSDGLRQQLKRDKLPIRVTVVRPAATATNYWGTRNVPKEKFLTPEEVSEIIQFVIATPETVTIKSVDMESARF